jgi:hypothetical protein
VVLESMTFSTKEMQAAGPAMGGAASAAASVRTRALSPPFQMKSPATISGRGTG